MPAVALIPTDLQRTRLGMSSRLGDRLGPNDRCCILDRTIRRAARVKGLEAVVLVHPEDQAPMRLLDAGQPDPVPVSAAALPTASFADRFAPMRRASRRWAPESWRGGPGGLTVYDELLPAAPLLAAMDQSGATSALLLGPDWCFLDPDLCSDVLARHLDQPEGMKLVFTQAPPGLCGIAVHRSLIQQLAGTEGSTFGSMLGYHPTRPQADPIGKDVCVQIDAVVRSSPRRYIADTPRSAWMLARIAERFPDDAPPSARQVCQAGDTIGLESLVSGIAPFAPRLATLELTARRPAPGPIIPQSHVPIDRPDMPGDRARAVIDQLTAEPNPGDLCLTLGGLGDALLHPDWADLAIYARERGVWSLCVQTDLLVEASVLERLLQAPIDIVTVRMNADRARTYEQAMGLDADTFKRLISNMEWLLNERNRRAADPHRPCSPAPGVPWIVPSLVKTAQTLDDLETFFDRWTHFAGHALIEGPSDGCGLMPDQALADMSPPRRFACRQLDRRLTVQADGRAVLCDQDWLGRRPIGDAASTPALELWRASAVNRRLHHEGQWQQIDLCARCRQWHRP